VARVKKALPTPDDKAASVRRMFDAIAPRYDLVNRVMTFGMDVGWRKRTVRALRLPSDSLVLDVACGTGDLCRELERVGHRAVGFDFSPGMIQAARTDAPLVLADALALPLSSATVDGITCGFALRNVVDVSRLFEEFARVLRSGGRVALLEVSEPANPVLKTGHRLYFRGVVPVIGGLLSNRDAYRYLPASVAYLPSVPELTDMLSAAGFSDVARVRLALGAAQIISGSRR
jgi:demethylmenaquinone methyltransferase/2-methoxy-6-polyprenyl-1,4-benzoquinol methylase